LKTHVEIKIRLRRIPEGGLHKILRDFADNTEGWHFPNENSEEYQRHHGSDAGFVACLEKAGLERSAIAVANLDRKHPNTFEVPNIVPRECSSLTLDQYNAIGLAFANEFRRWLKQSHLRGSLQILGPTKTLADIIPGEKSRKFFEAWLHTPAPTSHPSDLNVLDRFICHLFRHRGTTRIWEIESYLVEDKGWRPEIARWAARRIETGLDLLRVDRKFH
jgi:hypothetical protein